MMWNKINRQHVEVKKAEKDLTELVFILDRSGSMSGLEGDTITIDNGLVSVNGVQLREDYVTTGLTPRHDGTYIVEQGCVFVMGDNRLVSRDSTDGMVGSIPVARVIGRVDRVLFPFSRSKRMQGVQYGV